MATVKWAARMAGQLQHHQELDTTPPTPLQRRIQSAMLELANVLSFDEMREVNDDLAGQLPAIQAARLEEWFNYAEAAYGSN